MRTLLILSARVIVSAFNVLALAPEVRQKGVILVESDRNTVLATLLGLYHGLSLISERNNLGHIHHLCSGRVRIGVLGFCSSRSGGGIRGAASC